MGLNQGRSVSGVNEFPKETTKLAHKLIVFLILLAEGLRN